MSFKYGVKLNPIPAIFKPGVRTLPFGMSPELVTVGDSGNGYSITVFAHWFSGACVKRPDLFVRPFSFYSPSEAIEPPWNPET